MIKRKIFGAACICFFLIATLSSDSYGQQRESSLGQRVRELEAQNAALQSNMINLSEELGASILEYTKGLEKSLDAYSQKLQTNLEESIRNVNSRRVIINPFVKEYQSIETNTGTFLIAVDRAEQIAGGYRLHLKIGNPNYADYQNFKLKLAWGGKWPGEYISPYNEWRQTLDGAEFTFQGRLEKGMWNSIAVDLISDKNREVGYVECEMDVSSVELGFK